MATPPLTRSIGTAERSLRALLERELEHEGLSFPQWTALVFTSAAPLSFKEIAQRQLAGHVVSGEPESQAAVNDLITRAVLSKNAEGALQHSDRGHALFLGISAAVERITNTLYGDLPQADLEAAHRTLIEISARATKLLAAK